MVWDAECPVRSHADAATASDASSAGVEVDDLVYRVSEEKAEGTLKIPVVACSSWMSLLTSWAKSSVTRTSLAVIASAAFQSRFVNTAPASKPPFPIV